MFGRSYEIMRLAGLPVRIHASWFIILLLVVWSLATGWFPLILPDTSPGTLWLLGTIGALGLFVSILLHEMSHAIVARRSGVPVRAITLFLFGGVAEMEGEPQSSKVELFVAIAGPVATVVIIGVLALVRLVGMGGGEPTALVATVDYLLLINGVLLGFNLVPAFPLDGGRVLRSLLWRWRDDLRWATRISARIGEFFGAALIVLGIFGVISGNLISGMWFALIGLFLRGAAGMSYQQLLLTRMLEGEPVSRFARTDVVVVPPELTLARFVEDYVYRHRHSAFPVVEEGRLVGVVESKEIRQIEPEKRETMRVRDILTPVSDEMTIRARQDSVEALARMRKNGLSRLMVVSPSGELEGLLSLSDLLGLFQLKLELEEGGGRAD